MSGLRPLTFCQMNYDDDNDDDVDDDYYNGGGGSSSCKTNSLILLGKENPLAFMTMETGTHLLNFYFNKVFNAEFRNSN